MFVLDTALSQCGDWRNQGLDLSVSVNLSARNLLDEDLPESIGRLLSKWGLPPEALELEITESSIMSDPRRARDVLHNLSEMGLRLSIDDYGTGHSSLAYLRKLPVNDLKIDKTFVLGMCESTSDAAIVRSTIELAHNLGLEVVAEGVETYEIWSQLQTFGCDSAQGFFFSRPVPPEALAECVQRVLATTSGGSSAFG